MVGPYLTALVVSAFNTQATPTIASSRTANVQIARTIATSNDFQEQVNRIVGTSAAYHEQIERVIATTRAARSQVNRQVNTVFDLKTQVDQRITSLAAHGEQISRLITVSDPFRTQVDRMTSSLFNLRSQVERMIAGATAPFRTQIDQEVTSAFTLKGQIERRIIALNAARTQISRTVSTTKITRTEIVATNISHQLCGGYLIAPYLTMPYLAREICAHLRTQVDRNVIHEQFTRTQIERRVTKAVHAKAQVNRQITKSVAFPTQILRQNTYKLNTQILRAIYNTDNIRILYDFPSRGTSGTNWTVVAGGTETGDFSINNVNTDVVEQQYRALNTTITIQSDTQVSQGIFNDTLAILNHNFTRSALVTMQASNDITFSSVPFSEMIPVEQENIYWVSPTLPLQSYRYWRFIISDSTNAQNLRIGTIVFGSSVIFNGECIVDEVQRRKTHFADRVKTEAFSNISNDRALKRSVSFSFRRLDFNMENYSNLTTVIDTVRTSLKALWIPTPRFSSRFAVFGKLAEIPPENHKAIGENADYIDLDITVDEAI